VNRRFLNSFYSIVICWINFGSLFAQPINKMGMCCSSNSASNNEDAALLDNKNKPIYFDPRSPDPQVHRTPFFNQRMQQEHSNIGLGIGGSAFQPVNRGTEAGDNNDVSRNLYGSVPKNVKLKGQSR
jgi:hypothetical protein